MQMGYAEYKSNMELGQVFVDVMTKIAEQGYGFVGPELMTWHENSQWINTYQGLDADGNGVEYVDLDEHIFNSISHHDRVRTLGGVILCHSFWFIFVSLV